MCIEKESLKIPGIIRIRKSKKDRQHNDQRKSTKGQRFTKHTYKTKDRVTRTPLKNLG
jgi:hypothetical protein